MDVTVDSLLTLRSRPLASRRRAAALLISFLFHLLLVLSLLLAPMIRRAQREPIEFVAIQIVPVQALGVPAPRPSPPREESRPAPPPPPAPAKEAKPAAPSPEPKPQTAPRDRPAAERPAAEAAPSQRQGSPLGSATGFSSFGAEVSALDAPNFGYNYYLEQMLAMIGGNWVRPPVPAGVQAEVVFRVMRDGRVEDIELSRSSGHGGFDLAAVRAVRLASPLPKLPQSYREDSLRVRLVVR